MYIATFMKGLETCEGEMLWVIGILLFEACRGSTIANEESSFGTGASSFLRVSFKLKLCLWPH